MSREFWKEYPESVIKRFKDFHEKNPQVWERFKELALKMSKAGKTKYSARTIIEVMRWEHDLKSKEDGSSFRINGNFVPIYARLVIYNYPSMEGFFELRRIRSKGVFSEEENTRRGREYGKNYDDVADSSVELGSDLFSRSGSQRSSGVEGQM